MTLQDDANALTPKQLTAIYLRYKEAKDEVAKAKKLLDAKLRVMQGILLDRMEQLGQDSFNALGQVVYQSTLTTWKVTDREEFLEYIRQHELYNLITISASKDEMNTFVADNGFQPPGSEKNSILKVNVRKGSTSRVRKEK